MESADDNQTKSGEMTTERPVPVFGSDGSKFEDSTDDSFNLAEELNRIHEKLANLSADNDQFRKDNEAVKTENRVLMAKLETIEQKLKVAELEAKLANDQMAKAIELKLAEQIGQLAEKLNKTKEKTKKRLDAQQELMTSKMAEENSKLQKQLQDMIQKFNGQEVKLASVDGKLEAELEKMAKQLTLLSTELRGKIASLQNQVADAHNKWEEFALKLTSLETKENLDNKMPKSSWHQNRWISAQYLWLNTDGLVATIMSEKSDSDHNQLIIRAKQPISYTILSITALQLAYFEVLVKKTEYPLSSQELPWIGWVDSDFPFNCGYYSHDMHSLDSTKNVLNRRDRGKGNYGTDVYHKAGYADKFNRGDVAGSGLLLTRDGRMKIFFTKNGRLNGKPMTLDNNQNMLLFCPAVNLSLNDHSVEANFGADLPKKPFNFGINAHEAVLFQ